MNIRARELHEHSTSDDGDDNPKKRKSGKRSKPKKTLAQRADKYRLYQKSVQCPDAEVPFFTRAYKRAFGRSPVILREDFCGTAAVSCEWVASKRGRVAYGVDLDPEPLTWGSDYNAAGLDDEARSRLHLIEGDVRSAETPPADVIAAQNFSFYIFKERQLLLEYFKAAYGNIAEQGVMVLDMFGGGEVWQDDHQEERQYKKFNYIWDQHSVDPISHDATFYIHFYFPKDKSRIHRAFTYEWRLWTIREVRELLEEAGFARSVVYWEGSDGEGEGNGVYKPKKRAPADPAWVCYVVAIKDERAASAE
ncbi:MAG: class I SAM-dependent methyltransferase [Myxococcales bacterium]|nr:class I SAM-dependent methyltransferase [Myxococcales bacterium]